MSPAMNFGRTRLTGRWCIFVDFANDVAALVTELQKELRQPAGDKELFFFHY